MKRKGEVYLYIQDGNNFIKSLLHYSNMIFFSRKNNEKGGWAAKKIQTCQNKKNIEIV